MLTAPTTADLAIFTGRPVGSFSGDFVDQALAQAALMFTVLTKLSGYPDDPDLAQLAKNAIMEMADRILLEQPYQAVKAGPFQAETIGSYSYSRTTSTTLKAQSGLKVGLFWWDTAIDELMVAGSSVLSHGGVQVDLIGIRQTDDGVPYVVDPAQDGGDMPPYVRIS